MIDEKMPEFAARRLLRFRGLHGPTLLIAQVGTERHVDVAHEARLTAAAPKLLSACKLAMGWLTDGRELGDSVVLRALDEAVEAALRAEPES